MSKIYLMEFNCLTRFKKSIVGIKIKNRKVI